MADKKKLKIIAGELRKASAMHKAQAKKIDSMSKGPSMISVDRAGAQKKSTAVGSVSPHSHDSSKNSAQPIPPITPPMPDNITGNIGNNFKVQELGANLFQGEALAEQEMAKRNLGKPIMPPSPDPVGDELGNMFMQPFSKNGDPVKSDTLYLPNKFKKQEGKMIDETDYDVLSKKVKNYKRSLVEDLQDMGRIKLNEQGKPYVVNRKNK